MEKLSFYGVDPSLDVRERLVKAGGEEAGLKFDESTKIEVLNRRALGKQLLEGPSAAYPWSKRCCNCHEVLVSGAYQDRFPTFFSVQGAQTRKMTVPRVSGTLRQGWQ